MDTRGLNYAPRVLLVLCIGALSACVAVPKPLAVDTNREKLEAGLEEYYGGQERLERPVSVEEATARAIMYNLDNRVKLMQVALAEGELGVARWELLPRMAARAGYTHRSKLLGSTSVSLNTGIESETPAASVDQDVRTAELGVAWNVLDFGVSYFQAKQQADRKLIWQERRRKAIHNLMQEVRLAWWQAAGAAALQKKAERVLAHAEGELATIRQERAERLRPPLESLKEERAMLETVRQMQAILDELAVARPRLAALMGLPPGTDFELAAVGMPVTALPAVRVPVEELERVALEHRPELREAAYEERISALEARKAIARLLPGFELSGSKQYNSNSFATYPNWWQGGMAVSWNLMNLPSAPQRINTANAGTRVARANSLALAMAVLSQVYVSRYQQGAAIRQYSLAEKQWEVEEQVLWYVKAGRSMHVVSEREYIRTEANAVKAELGMYMAHASLERAQGNVYASLGLDPLPDFDAAMSLERMTDTIERAFRAWEEGRYGWASDEVERMRQVSLLYTEGVALFEREEYMKASIAFAEALKNDPLHGAARQYAEVLVPQRLQGIRVAGELRRRAAAAQLLQDGGREEDARQEWNAIINEAQKEIQP